MKTLSKIFCIIFLICGLLEIAVSIHNKEKFFLILGIILIGLSIALYYDAKQDK
jgi:uncharacterized membrane protein